jgi:L-fuconolactonase
MRIDSHFHLWSLARGDYDWMAGSETLAPIRRDYSCQDARVHFSRHKIDRAVLVQAAPTVAETHYLLGLADANDVIGKVVGWVDFEDPTQSKILAKLARHKKFSGVRPMIQDIPDIGWMLREDIQWAYAACIDLDLTFDALGFSRHLENFLRIFERYPDLRVVVDHCMKPAIRDQAFEPWARDIAKIARNTNAFCKLSGLLTEAGMDASKETLAPYVRHIIESFGADRVMFGSDWPVLTLAASYDSWAGMVADLVLPADREAVFGKTAAQFYRL